jgi:hypothetical protein
MVGASPQSQMHDRAGQVMSPRARQHVQAPQHRAGSDRWRWIGLLCAFVPLSFVLVQCGQAPNAGTLAAN